MAELKTVIRRICKKPLLLAVLAILVGLGIWYVTQRQSTDASNATAAAVSRLAVVPADELPTITTVVDKSKIDQPFMKNAENGDQVLLYFNSGRAIVYRPSADKIINMGPLESPKPKVFLRDGSETTIPANFEARIIATGEYVIASRDESAKQDYTKTIVVDVAGNRPDVASKVATQIGAEVSSLPPGEDRPDGDILVIVGADAK
jgi:hypothetical protein